MLDDLIAELPARAAANPALGHRGLWTDATMLLEIGDEGWVVRLDHGEVSVHRETWRVSAWDFAIRGPREAWEKFWAPMPPPMHHDLHALIRAGHMRIEGDIDMLLGNMLYLKILLESLRGHNAD